MAILTPEQMKKEATWSKIKQILDANGYRLGPKVTISQTGLSFEIDLLDMPMANPGMPSGSGGGNNNG